MAEDQTPAEDAPEPEDGALDDLADLEFDDADGAADAPPAAALSPDGELDDDDLDDLIGAAPTADAAPGAAPEATASAPSVGGIESLAALAGDGLARITEFSTRLTEVLHVGLESVTGEKTTVASGQLESTTYEDVQASFADVPHVALRLKLAFSPQESEPLVVLMPLADAGALVHLQTDEDELADVDFRDRQLDAIATAVRELLDLMSLALFTDALMGAEVTLNEILLDSAADILRGVAADVADETALRLDVVLSGAAGEPMGLVVVMPTTLIARFSQALAPAPARPAAARSEPTPQATAPPPAAAAAQVGEAQPGGRMFDAGNVSPIRPTAAGNRVADDVDVHPVRFPNIGEALPAARPPRSLELLMDVEMRVSVELGRSSMSVEEILSLGPGSVVELNKLAGEPVDILVNDHLIARGEVVVVDENFGVRVTEIVSAHKRVHVMAR